MGSIKVSKTTAERLIKEGFTIKLLPCKVRLSNAWVEPLYVDIEMIEKYSNDFDYLVSQYRYYNCGNELGRYPAYYLHLDFTLCSFTDRIYGHRETLCKYAELLKEHNDFIMDKYRIFN